jgi:hypothetical protein
LNYVKPGGLLSFSNSYVADLVVLGNHYFKQYSTIQFNFISYYLSFGGAPTGVDPSYGFQYWKLWIFLGSVALISIIVGIVTCLIRNRSLRKELEEWKRGKQEAQ